MGRPAAILAIAISIGAAALPSAAAAQAKALPAAAAPVCDDGAVDRITGTVHSRRLPTGVPLGGLGTGTIQVMTDGRISMATINNNWAFPTGDLPACFAAVHARVGTATTTRVLALSSAYGLPVAPAVDFDGLFPIANLSFPNSGLPVSISARAFSPLIPHDIRNSSFPAVAFVFRITNVSMAEVEISTALSWENTLGVGGTATTGRFDNRTGSTVASVPDTEGFFAQRFSHPIENYTNSIDRLKGNAAGEMTLMAAPGRPQAIVTSAAWNAFDAKPGWWGSFERDGSLSGTAGVGRTGQTHPAGVLAVRVTLRPRETVDLPFAVSWYTPRLHTIKGGDYGHYYQNVWPDSYAVARGLLTEWHSLLALTEEWQQRLLFSNLPRWMARRLINCASPVTQHSLFTRDQSFAMLDSVATSGMPAGATPAADTAVAAAEYRPSSEATAKPGTRLVSLSQRLVVSELLNDMFPMLSARELRLFMARQAVDGMLPRTLGDIDHIIGVPQSGSFAAIEKALALTIGPYTPVLTPEALDDISAFLIQMAQYVLKTGDQEFLQVYFPNIHQSLTLALENIAADGLPAPAAGRLSPADASLFIGALQAGTRLCNLSGSHAYRDLQIHSGILGAIEALARSNRRSDSEKLAARCEQASRRAADCMEKRYWSQSLYVDQTPAGHAFSQIDQLIGIALFDLLGGSGPAEADQPGPIPASRIEFALSSILKLNDGVPAGNHAPVARVPVKAIEAPLSAPYCDFGRAILGETVLALTRDHPDDAVAALRRLDELRSGPALSPWQCPNRFPLGGGSAPAPDSAGVGQAADWNVLAPLQGFSIDLTSGQMSLSPSIPGNWRSLAAPVFAPTFWGRMEFRPTARGGLTNLRIDRLIALPAATASRQLSGSAGILLTRIRISGPPPRPAGAPPIEAPLAHVSRGTTPLGVKTVRDKSGDFILIFETPVKLTAGDRLEIDLH